MAKSKTTTPDLFEPDLTNSCADFVGADTYKKRIKAVALFCLERHRIYIKKSSGLPKPWTLDPILQSYRFCNIYRELDNVTEWIMANVINPNLDNPNIGCLAIAARLINHPDTLKMMMEEGFDFRRKPNHERLYKLFAKIQATKGKQLVTGVYICNTIFPKGYPKIDGTKSDYLANFFVPEVWKHRDALAEGIKTNSFHQTIDAFKTVHGIGAFIGNQAAVDLTYTKLLSSAKDIDTTWNPGPGTTKGIRWVTGDYSLVAGSKAMDEALTTMHKDLNAILSTTKMWSDDPADMKTNMVRISGPNLSNVNCEVAKIVWMALGKRERLKNSYPGAR